MLCYIFYSNYECPLLFVLLYFSQKANYSVINEQGLRLRDTNVFIKAFKYSTLLPTSTDCVLFGVNHNFLRSGV